jgi:hypothetical protein
MNDAKSSISQAETYQEIGEYWDSHELIEIENENQSADFVISGHKNTKYYPVEKMISEKLHIVAQKRGISAEILVNLWLQEKITQEAA